MVKYNVGTYDVDTFILFYMNKARFLKEIYMRKLLIKLLLKIAIILAIISVGLIINNRIFYLKYLNIDTKKDYLSEKDINRIHNVFNYLSEEGESILTGFDGNDMSLLIYNESYEFLFSDSQPSSQEWTYMGKDKYLDKFIYRRLADNSQAFAVKVDSSWAGSFATMDTYHKQMLREIPIFYPPQLISVDEQYYKAIVIHEMTHAYQGKYNSSRVEEAGHIHSVCSTYYADSQFNKWLKQEAEYLEVALQSNDTDTVRKNVQSFLQTRSKRRKECQMTDKDIYEEQEIEWLEGLARYSEYKVSRDSSSLIAKGLSNISEKVKVKNDDRYYVLGMAEYMIILKLDKNYDQNIFKNNDALENILFELCLQLK